MSKCSMATKCFTLPVRSGIWCCKEVAAINASPICSPWLNVSDSINAMARCVTFSVPLLNFEWVDELVFWRMGRVKSGRSPAQRTLEADRAPATLA